MNNERIKKLESISRKLITSFIFEEIEDTEKNFWIITITWIKISTDLSYLDIYVSSLQNWEILTKTLAKHNNEVQKRLNKLLNIRKLPKIRYRYDNSWAKWQEICQTINKIV